MTLPFSKNILPDSLTGMVFAMEGIPGALTLLNGPMGCKFFHSSTSSFLCVRPKLYLPNYAAQSREPVDFNYLNNYFFRQTQVPSTYLDGFDYCYGTEQKVKDALLYMRGNIAFDIIAVINSPGAALIGDRLENIIRETFPKTPAVMLESPGYSQSFEAGYDRALRGLLESLSKQGGRQIKAVSTNTAQDTKCGGCSFNVRNNSWPSQDTDGTCKAYAVGKTDGFSVNILGLSIWHRYAEGDRRQIEDMLNLCSIKANAFLGFGATVEQIKNLARADLNVIIHPESAIETAQFLKEEYGMEYYICDGPPIGFDACENMMEDICGILYGEGKQKNTAQEPFKEKTGRARGLAWYHIDAANKMYGLPQNVPFAIEGSASGILSYLKFLSGYLGMTPVCVDVATDCGGTFMESIRHILKQCGQPGALHSDIMQKDAELVFGSGGTISAMLLRTDAFCGIEIANPTIGYRDIVPKSHMGIDGALFLLEQCLNGLMGKL